MAKEAMWSHGIIDDDQNLIKICSNCDYNPSEVFLQCIKAGYNVTDNMILHFKWLGIDWDYMQIITIESDVDEYAWVRGLRLFKRSQYLNAYYIVSNCVKDDFSLEKHFYTGYNNPIKRYYKFDVHYDYEGGQYNIVVDIIDFYEGLYSNYNLYEKCGKLYVKYDDKKSY